MLGGPVLRPKAGAASTRTMPPITTVAKTGRRNAASTKFITAATPVSSELPIVQRLTLGPSSAISAGATTVETETLRMMTTIIVTASETSRAPGRIGTETTIARNRVLPANTVVRPAVRRVFAAASKGGAPSASSSLKRETINSA